jgi:uncharacterized Rmd1/YagE family protein
LYPRATKFPQRTSRTNKKLVFLPKEQEDTEFVATDDVVDLTSDPERARTVAEKMSKEQRFILPRVTSYCRAVSFDLEKITEWVVSVHNVTPKQYDECLYIYYNSHSHHYTNWNGQSFYRLMTVELAQDQQDPFGIVSQIDTSNNNLPNWMFRKECFVFDYGVAVFWNFTEEDELRYLENLCQFCTKPLDREDIEVENLHFQYDLTGPIRPRIFNDMITYAFA